MAKGVTMVIISNNIRDMLVDFCMSNREGCRRNRRGHKWRRWGGASSGQAWDEHAEGMAAKEAEAVSTEAKEQQSAAAEEA